MKVPSSSLLYLHPSETGEVVPKPPLHPPKEGFQLALTGLWVLWPHLRIGQVTTITLPLQDLKAVLFMLAMCLKRFLRLALENPLILPLISPPLIVTRFLFALSDKEIWDREPPTAEDT